MDIIIGGQGVRYGVRVAFELQLGLFRSQLSRLKIIYQES